jgi:thiamine biosynthesis lipoprotein
VPTEEDLEALMQHVGYEDVVLSGQTVTMEEGCTLDLGAVGKGLGCDRISEYLKGIPEVDGALINLGGSSVMSYGTKPDGSSWKIAVTDPRDTEGDYLGVISLEGEEFLSTSGDYAKYFIQDGVRYHHILDPSTGYPAQSGVQAVTVVCDNGLYADGLSTACFVLGVEKGTELLKQYGADGLFVDDQRNVLLTEGMESRFELIQTSYSVKRAGE